MPDQDPMRRMQIVDTIWFWLPARWTNGTTWFEVKSINIKDSGADVLVARDGSDATVAVSFLEEELVGDGRLSPETAKARIEAI